MILAALRAGLKTIGFSSHCRTGYDFDPCQLKDPELYFNELEFMKHKYKGKINVYTGLELESFVYGEKRPSIDRRCDYAIGSIHYVRNEGKYFTVDYTHQEIINALKAFKGRENFLDSYFEDFLSFADTVPFDIVGHVDVFTKFNEKYNDFDENDSKYQKQVLSHIEKLAAKGRIFEVNTGAIDRGYRSTPYPAPFILKKLYELKSPVIINSDSHSVDTICQSFDLAEKLLKDIGYKEQMTLTENGFVSVPL